MNTKSLIENITKANESARAAIVQSLKSQIFKLDEHTKNLLINTADLKTRKQSLMFYKKERSKMIKNTIRQAKGFNKHLLTKKDKIELKNSWLLLELHVLY